MTGANSGGTHKLALSGFEVFGKVFQVPFPSALSVIDKCEEKSELTSADCWTPFPQSRTGVALLTVTGSATRLSAELSEYDEMSQMAVSEFEEKAHTCCAVILWCIFTG